MLAQMVAEHKATPQVAAAGWLGQAAVCICRFASACLPPRRPTVCPPCLLLPCAPPRCCCRTTWRTALPAPPQRAPCSASRPAPPRRAQPRACQVQPADGRGACHAGAAQGAARAQLRCFYYQCDAGGGCCRVAGSGGGLHPPFCICLPATTPPDRLPAVPAHQPVPCVHHPLAAAGRRGVQHSQPRHSAHRAARRAQPRPRRAKPRACQVQPADGRGACHAGAAQGAARAQRPRQHRGKGDRRIEDGGRQGAADRGWRGHGERGQVGGAG